MISNTLIQVAIQKLLNVAHDLSPLRVTVRPGETWHPQRLIVRAFDADNQFLPAVPLIISISEAADILDTRGSGRSVQALKPGREVVTVSSYCERGPELKIEFRELDDGG